MPTIPYIAPIAWGSLLRNWWNASDYEPNTGSLIAHAGQQQNTLGQATSSRRPGKTLANLDFGNNPTIDSDGIDDALSLASTFCMSQQPNTFGVLMQTTGAGSSDYIGGQYSSSSYQFYRANHTADTIYTDPSAQSYPLAGTNGVHLWLFSKNGTELTTYRDGVKLGVKTMTSSTGTAGAFWLFSAGSGSIKASIAEVFTLDVTIGDEVAVLLTNYFKNVCKYPIASVAEVETEVFILLGDSKGAGRGDPADLVTVYPGYPSASNLFMFKTGGPWTNLVDPCADGTYPPVGVGPGGMFGYMRSLQTGKPVAIINCAIGGKKSSDWLPGTSAYQMCLNRALPALTRAGSYLGGYLLCDGANDATDIVSNWSENWDLTFSKLMPILGFKTIYYTVLPETVPEDLPYPQWVATRDQQLAWQTQWQKYVLGPEGPWRESYKLHLNTAGEYIMSTRWYNLFNS